MKDQTPDMPQPTALVISRDESLVDEIRGLRGMVRRLRLEVCDSVARTRAALERGGIAMMLVHVTPSSDAAEVVRLLADLAVEPRCPAVILSDIYHDDQAGVFLGAGAADYLGRPLDHGKLACIMDILATRTCPALPAAAAPATSRGFEPDVVPQVLLGPDMMELMEQLRRVVPQETTLLLTGETGTGKTRLARFVHELSPRRDEPFLVVDCGALSASLIESELFGHVQGAFTGADRDSTGKLAAAGKGTLLLDEVNSLPLPLQAKLLRAVDERVFEPVGADKGQPFCARLMATSNAVLEKEVATGRFRADLFTGSILSPLPPRCAASRRRWHRWHASFGEFARAGRTCRAGGGRGGAGPGALSLAGQCPPVAQRH